MKIFVVSQHALVPSAGPGSESLLSLIQTLARIKISRDKTISVVAVTDTYNLDVDDSITQDDIADFVLDEFRDRYQQSVNDENFIDGNRLANKLNKNTCNWVAIDLEQNLPVNTIDLIRKLSRYVFMSKALQDKTLVMLVPPLYVGFYVRTVNEAFNNLPIGSFEIDRSGQINMLFISSSMERVILSLPLLTEPIRRLSRLFVRVYQRLIRRA